MLLPRQDRRCLVLHRLALRFRNWWKGRAALAGFYGSLTPVRVGRNDYTKTDRYRDFRAVFTTPEGRKVLSQIIAYSEGLPVSEREVSDTHRTAFRAGQRDTGLWIVRVLNAEPLDQQ